MKNLGYILVSAICFALTSCNMNNDKPVMFHIPENYSGKFFVVYEENCGIDPAVENDSLVYIIPENGVLILKDKYRARMLYHSYYLTNSSGRTEKLDILLKFDDQYGTKRGVLSLGTGSIGGVSPDGIQVPKDKTINYEMYYIVNKDSAKYNDQQSDSIMQQIVYDRRKGSK